MIYIYQTSGSSHSHATGCIQLVACNIFMMHATIQYQCIGIRILSCLKLIACNFSFKQQGARVSMNLF